MSNLKFKFFNYKRPKSPLTAITGWSEYWDLRNCTLLSGISVRFINSSIANGSRLIVPWAYPDDTPTSETPEFLVDGMVTAGYQYVTTEKAIDLTNKTIFFAAKDNPTENVILNSMLGYGVMVNLPESQCFMYTFDSWVIWTDNSADGIPVDRVEKANNNRSRGIVVTKVPPGSVSNIGPLNIGSYFIESSTGDSSFAKILAVGIKENPTQTDINYWFDYWRNK